MQFFFLLAMLQVAALQLPQSQQIALGANQNATHVKPVPNSEEKNDATANAGTTVFLALSCLTPCKSQDFGKKVAS